MYNSRLYLKIVLNILLILLLSGSGFLLIISRWAVIIGIFLIIWAVFQTRHLINILNKTNRRIALFLDAIQDKNTRLYFPEEHAGKEELQLNQAFNRVSKIICNIQLESQKQELFYKALLEHVPSGVLSWDTSGRILTVNPAALRLLSLNSLNHIRQLEEKHPEFRQVVHPAGFRRSFDIRLNNEHGYRQLTVVRNTMILQEQTVVLLSIQDIREQLNEKESESWIRLTHVLTHEIMNSIAPITSLSETLSSYFEHDGIPIKQEDISEQVIQKTVKGLSIVKRRGKSLLHFAESYRKLTFIPTPVIQAVQFREFAENLLHLLSGEPEAEKINFRLSVSPENLVVKADEELLSQVLINLLKNAMQALAGQTNGQIRLTASLSEQILIEITDNGPGVPTDSQDDIFVPFFTTKPSGTGIGLSLSRQIVRLHGGELSLHSCPGQETRFIISLPGR